MAEILGIHWKSVQEKQQNIWKYCTCQHKQFSHAHLAYTCIDLGYVQKKQMKAKAFHVVFFTHVHDCSSWGKQEELALVTLVGGKGVLEALWMEEFTLTFFGDNNGLW